MGAMAGKMYAANTKTADWVTDVTLLGKTFRCNNKLHTMNTSSFRTFHSN